MVQGRSPFSLDPRVAKSYAVDNLPDPTASDNQVVIATNESQGAVPVYSDGLNWRRTSDDAIASKLPLTIMWAGQSNGAATPPVNLGFSAMLQHLGVDLLGFNQTTQTFTQLVDGSANSRANFGGGGTGPGPGGGQVLTLLMRRIADQTGQTVRSYASAFTSQSIDYFLPASPILAFFEDGSQHPTLNNYNLLKSYVTASGINPDIYGIIQGEADAGMSQTDYKAKLNTLRAALVTDYGPTIKMLIVGTIGDLQDRGAGGSLVTGVRLAQKQLADENPGSVFFVDTTDMAGSTAYFDGIHYSTYMGFEEVAERCFAVLRGDAQRPAVKQIASLANAFTWDQICMYRHSIVGGDVVIWQGTTASLVPNTNAPEHIANDPDLNNRSSVDFDAANNETMKITGLPATSDWCFFGVSKLDLLAASKYMFLITRTDNSNRAALVSVGGSNIPAFFYGGVSSSFNPLPFNADTIRAHSWCWTLDTTNLISKLYVDGLFQGSVTIDGSQTLMTDIWIASLLQTSIQDGPWGCFAWASGTAAIPTDAQVAAIHASVQVEFGLASPPVIEASVVAASSSGTDVLFVQSFS